MPRIKPVKAPKIEPHPKWLAVVQARKAAQEAAMEAAEAEDRVLVELVNEALPGRNYVVGDLEEGSWECPDPESPSEGEPASPTGFCVYDPHEDPCRDSCIFCGHPQERK